MSSASATVITQAFVIVKALVPSPSSSSLPLPVNSQVSGISLKVRVVTAALVATDSAIDGEFPPVKARATS